MGETICQVVSLGVHHIDSRRFHGRCPTGDFNRLRKNGSVHIFHSTFIKLRR